MEFAKKLYKNGKELEAIMLSVMPASYYFNMIINFVILVELVYGYFVQDIDQFLYIGLAWYIIGVIINFVAAMKMLQGHKSSVWNLVSLYSFILLCYLQYGSF